MFCHYHCILLLLLKFQNINSYIISDFKKFDLRKYFNQNNFVNNKNSKQPIVRKAIIMNSNKNDLAIASINMNRINDYQWDLFTNYQLGLWKGVQTGYDPLNDDVADYMYTEVDLNYISNDKKEVKHTNSMVAGEIRADCEVCFDSERLKSKEIGIYTKGKLKSRLCYNSELRGPGSNPRGMSMELILRHLDGRIRIIYGYSPDVSEEAKTEGFIEDFQDSETKQFFSLAYRLILRDIVIVRERLQHRPLQIEGNIDNMWSTDNVTPKDIYDLKRYQGQRMRMNMSGETSSELLLLTNNENNNFNILNLISSPISSIDNNESVNSVKNMIDIISSSSITSSISNKGLLLSTSNNNDIDQYIRLFPGGILLSAPKYILTANNDAVDIRATWIHPPTTSVAATTVTAAATAVESTNNLGTSLKNMLNNINPLTNKKSLTPSSTDSDNNGNNSNNMTTIFSVGTKILFTEPAVLDSDVVYIKPPRLTDYYVDVLYS